MIHSLASIWLVTKLVKREGECHRLVWRGGTQRALPSSLNSQFSTPSRLDGAVEGLAGRRGGFVIFDEAGGGRGVRGEVGPSTGHAGGALQAVGDIGRTGLSPLWSFTGEPQNLASARFSVPQFGQAIIT